MRRGIRGKSRNPYFPPASDRRPQGLRGKEIGLYYRDLGRKKNLIKLRVPETVLTALHDNIKYIEEVALKESIYLEPVKELNFIKPHNIAGADFIPLKVEKGSHHVTNIIPKDNDVIFVSKKKTDFGYEDDVIFVKTVKTEPVFISDDEATVSSYDSKMEIDVKPTAHKKARADMRPYYNLDEDNVSSDSDTMTCKKIKAKIELVSCCSSTDDVILLDDSNKDIKASKSDLKPLWIFDNGTISSTEADSVSMPDKKIKVQSEHHTDSSTKLYNAILNVKPSKSDAKPIWKRTVDTISCECSNADSRSMADKKIEPEPDADSSTKLKNAILNVKPSKSDIKPIWKLTTDTISSESSNADSRSMADKKIEFEPNADSSTKLNNAILNVKSSKSDIKPIWKLTTDTISSESSNAYSKSMADKKIEIEPDADSSTKLNNAILNVKPSKSDIKPIWKLTTDTISSESSNADSRSMADKKIEIEPDAGSSSKLNDVIVLDGNDDVKSKYTCNETHLFSMISSQQESNKDYKYGYEDIITGRFEDKLDESLAKGIEINIKNKITNQLSEALFEEFSMMEQKPKYQEMIEFRKTLPTYKMADELLNVVNNNQVVVISGETGCGKSTQVPQIILDDALKNKKAANVKILVTEPRRIAASSLAMRVAEERAESMGKSVGYSVRLERVECRHRGSIMFCTTGVLLVELEVNQSLSNYTHIIVDEVHERDCQIDISLCMLRQVLKKRKDLKLILMSATIDSESLSAYYDNCPMLHIKGLAYPVRDVYLEEILHMTRYRLPPPQNTAQRGNRPQKPWMKHVKSRNIRDSDEMAKEIQYRAEIGPWLESIKKSIDRDVYQTLQDQRIEKLDVHLILQLLICISRSDPGAILVFLPGINEITKLIRLMHDSHQFPDTLFDIYPLHSKLPTLTQRKIFTRPPGNIRKIIVATNIAETSITIDDIVYVVDCAKVKYKGLSVKEHVSTLQTEWASQANLRQRRGRAGRCQPGICYHLVTSYRASQLQERLLPELLRDDLLETVLQIKRLRLGMAVQALSMMPAVPHTDTICNAIRHLQQCGALDERETLTPLGWHMARLPVHPAAGKLLILGSLFGCLDRAASVAAVWGFKDPFNLVIGKEKQINEAKKNLALGEPSDHIAISEAIIQWERLDSYTDRNIFAYSHFLSMSTLKLLSDMKKQFGNNLKQMGFLHSGDIKSVWENRNSDNLALFKTIVAAALYPNIACVRWKNLNSNKQPYMLVKTCDTLTVTVHPSSVMARNDQKQRSMPLCSNPGANWLVYWLKQRSTNLYLIEVTLVYTLPLLFFGELNVTEGDSPEECLIDINSIKVSCNRETTLLLFRLRSLLDQVLAAKIMASGEGKRSTIFEEQVLNAVKNLITAEDARTEYLDDDDRSGSEDYNEGRAWTFN